MEGDNIQPSTDVQATNSTDTQVSKKPRIVKKTPKDIFQEGTVHIKELLKLNRPGTINSTLMCMISGLSPQMVDHPLVTRYRQRIVLNDHTGTIAGTVAIRPMLGSIGDIVGIKAFKITQGRVDITQHSKMARAAHFLLNDEALLRAKDLIRMPARGFITVERVLQQSTPLGQPISTEGEVAFGPLLMEKGGEAITVKPTLDPYRGPQNEQQRAVVEAFMHAWTAYKTYAWGHDELRPVSKGWQEWFGIGLTIVDSLDTMHIMGLKDEFKLGRDWVARNMTLKKDIDAQLFEIVIRALGGLLSAYHLSDDKVFLNKAIELGEGLFPCFHGPTKIPCNRINLKSGRGSFIEISTAETGTIQLEFRDLARASNMSKFEKAMDDISLHLHNLPKLDGLVSCFINSQTGLFRPSSTVSVGASADSYYEYLLKQWLQTGKTKEWLKNDYLEAVEGTKKHLLRYSEPSRMAFVGALSSMTSKGFRSEMEHLACFLPGTLALGYMEGLDKSHLDLAVELTKTCYEMYRRMPTGLSPEVVGVNINPNGKDDLYVSYSTQFNLQRPETVESLFYMYRATKDKKYQQWGWEIFRAFEKHTRLKEGYASIDSVRRPENPGYRDKMETFYLAETLKYLYLLFSDDPNLLPLDKFVINTEAHPLPRYHS